MTIYEFYTSVVGSVGLDDPVFIIFVLSTTLVLLETFFKSMFSAVFSAFHK